MKKYYLCLLLTALCFNGFSQTKLDSLKKVLAKLPPEGRSFAGDTMRVRVLCEMGRIDNNDSIAKKNIDKALSLAQSNKVKKLEYKALYSLGRHLKKNGLYFEAIAKLYDALFLSEELKDLKEQAICLMNIADAHTWIDQYPKSIILYDKSLKVFLRLKLYEDYVDCLNNKALAYYGMGNYDEAIKLFKECMKYEKYVKGKLSEASYLSNLGSAYGKKKEFDVSLNYFAKTLKVFESLGEEYHIYSAVTKAEMAGLYEQKKDYDKAIILANEALSINSKYFGAGLIANQVLHRVYSKINQPINAYKHLLQYLEAKETSEKVDKEKRLASLKFQYDNQKQEIEINQLNFQKKSLLIGLCIFLLFISVQIWNTLRLRKKNHLIRAQKDEIITIKNELEIFNKTLEQKVEERTNELQIVNEELILKNREISEALFKGQTIERQRVASELHDNLGATLSAIKWRLQAINSNNLNEKEKKIYDGILGMMDNTYSEVRMISHNMLPAELATKGLIGAIEKLIDDVNQVGKINLVLYYTKIDFGLDKKVELELYSICLELINNIIKHSEATEANIEFSENNKLISISVFDNGKGIDPEFKNGMGLINLKKRLDTISGYFDIKTGPGYGTNIIIQVPYLVK